MNIIGGEFKGRKLFSPKGEQTRPTSALVRKAVFDICREEVEDAVFLDLFAGSGAMGLEALSRGAKEVVFVEQNKQAIDCIQKNIAALKVEDRAKILRGDALKILKKIETPFTLVYIDPPYDLAHLIAETLELLAKRSPGALVFVEEGAPSSQKISSAPYLRHRDTRQFGKSLLHKFSLL